jgi:uncharacterized protein YceH (UPF0502 family)
MDMTVAEARVLGCLVEAQVVHPDVYAVTLDELRFSCNQTTGRDPVMMLDDRTVEDTLLVLRSRGLVRFVMASRAVAGPTTYRHRADERWRLGSPELAVLSILLLRGPQTVEQVWALLGEPGFAGSRTEVEAALDTLGGRTPHPLARRLSPPAGSRDVMWVEALTAWSRPEAPGPSAAPAGRSPQGANRPAPGMAEIADRLTNIERRLANIEAALLALRPGGPNQAPSGPKAVPAPAPAPAPSRQY